MLITRAVLRATPVFVAALIILNSPAALGQIVQLPTDKLTLDDADKKVMTDYVAAHSTNLENDDGNLIKRDKAMLVEPLQKANVSVAFRLEYSRLLVARLKLLVASNRDLVAINSVVISGELATNEGVDLVIDGLAGASGSVRMTAAAAARRTFQSAKDAVTPAISDDAGVKLVAVLEAKLKVETDPVVTQGIVRALLAAADLSKNGFDPTRTSAIKKVCATLSGRAELAANTPLDAAWLNTLMIACGGLRDQMGGNNAKPLSNASLKEISELAGHILAHAARVVLKGNLPPMNAGGAPGQTPIRELYAQLSQLAETLVLSAGRSLQSGFTVSPRNLAGKLRADAAKSDGEFVIEVEQIVGAGGDMSKAPFEFAPGMFKTK